MTVAQASLSPPASPPVRRADSSASWRLSDRIGLGFAWFLGLLFCAIAAAIVIYFLVEGIKYLRPSLLVTNPTASSSESQTGGFLDPLLGTVIIALMAMAIAIPSGIGIAVWLSEFGRPTALARLTESCIEMLAGTVLATARALGEAVMLSMVSGGVGFSPNPADGLIFLFEPSRPLAATIISNTEQLSSPPMKHTLYAIAAVLLFSAAMLSVIGWAAKQPMKRYGVVA